MRIMCNVRCEAARKGERVSFGQTIRKKLPRQNICTINLSFRNRPNDEQEGEVSEEEKKKRRRRRRRRPTTEFA